MRMIILPRAAAGVSTARMISRERFAFDLEKFSQWEVSIRLLSFSARPHSLPSPLPLCLHTHRHTLSIGGFYNGWWGKNLAFTSLSSSSANTVTPVTVHDAQWPSSNIFLIAFDGELAPCWSKGPLLERHRVMQDIPLSAGTGRDPLRRN